MVTQRMGDALYLIERETGKRYPALRALLENLDGPGAPFSTGAEITRDLFRLAEDIAYEKRLERARGAREPWRRG
jgi:hypothetical protein